MGMMGAGGQMALRAGLRQRIEDQLRRRMEEQQMALAARGADRADRQLEQSGEQNQLMRESLNEQRMQTAHNMRLTQAHKLDESTPPGLIPVSPETEPLIGQLRLIGAGTDQAERPAVDVGPLLPGDTGEARQEGFLKRESPAQTNIRTDNEEQVAAREQRGDDAEANRDLRRELAGQAAANKPEKRQWVMRNGQPVYTEDTVSGDTPYRAPQSISDNAQDRQRRARTQAAKGFLDRLNVLREKINTKMGPAAGIGGTVRRGAASIGMDPDVAEYERIRAAAGRSLAVAIMGAQNLSDQDANAWAGMLPGATVDRDTAKRLTDQVGTMLADMDVAPPPGAGPAMPSRGGGSVRMRAPDGRALNVPADKVADMEARGATKVP